MNIGPAPIQVTGALETVDGITRIKAGGVDASMVADDVATQAELDAEAAARADADAALQDEVDAVEASLASHDDHRVPSPEEDFSLISLSSTGSWESKNLSAVIPADASIAFFQIGNSNSSSGLDGGARKSGSAAAREENVQPSVGGSLSTRLVPVDVSASKTVEFYRQSTDIVIRYMGAA